jgi:hypothetical protein
MKLKTSFTLRFKAVIAGVEFLAEVDCADQIAARNKIMEMETQNQDIELVAALVFLDLAREDGGCYIMDEENVEIYGELLRDDLKVGAEHFYNESLGSYDHLMNRVTPADLGEVFPDGTMRLVWEADTAAFDFGTTVELLTRAAETLLQAQDMPYFCQGEDELDANDFEPLKERRIELMFRAGLWPSSDGSFDTQKPEAVQAMLQHYATLPIPAYPKAA